MKNRQWLFAWLAAALLCISACSPSAAGSEQVEMIPNTGGMPAAGLPAGIPAGIPAGTETPFQSAQSPARTGLQPAAAATPAPLDDSVAYPAAAVRQDEIASLADPGKWIIVDLSEQRVYAREGSRTVFTFPVSTGRSENTAVGSFKILDKKPRPYSEPWGFWMPHWMGIYWVSGMQNGFHALPVLADGSELWRDQIGTPASYGCVVLLPEDMETLYQWAEVGMLVEIVE